MHTLYIYVYIRGEINRLIKYACVRGVLLLSFGFLFVRSLRKLKINVELVRANVFYTIVLRLFTSKNSSSHR